LQMYGDGKLYVAPDCHADWVVCEFAETTVTGSNSTSTNSTSAIGTGTPNYNVTDSSNIIENPWYDPRGVYSSCPIKNSVVLTFDDGPSNYTAELLDVLKANNVKATFFVIGSNLAESGYASSVKRAYDEGHTIGSHTWTHPHLMDLSAAQIIDEMTKTAAEIEKVIGFRPKYMRPPYGEYNDLVVDTLTGMGYKMMLWNLDTNDWAIYDTNPDGIYQAFADAFNTVSGASQQSKSWLSLQHDLYQKSVEQVDKIIKLAKSKGYNFYRVNDCFGDTPYSN